METEIKLSPIFTFGHYQGRQIFDIVQEDPFYIEWLFYQSWFRTKYLTEFNYLNENCQFSKSIY